MNVMFLFEGEPEVVAARLTAVVLGCIGLSIAVYGAVRLAVG